MYLHLSTALLFIHAACAAKVKNVIYVVPDGFGQASQTLARDYLNMVVDKQGTVNGPNSTAIGADSMVGPTNIGRWNIH
jgi:alkaline phosphatase